jgi:hypothetical protein
VFFFCDRISLHYLNFGINTKVSSLLINPRLNLQIESFVQKAKHDVNIKNKNLSIQEIHMDEVVAKAVLDLLHDHQWK